ncbi:inhibitor of growth protein 3, partial [Silurus meridionalis]
FSERRRHIDDSNVFCKTRKNTEFVRMLYLEDYLEMIEQLPMDLRDRFTEMREMDLQVQ